MTTLVLSYDIVANGRRARFRKKLLGFLDPVHKSVFQGDLPAARVAALERLIEGSIRPEVDAVVVWQLCRGCRGLRRSWGQTPDARDPDAPVVI